jgi:2-amino-4-hydroxy-6-hydroxymethyldihydropteridine diphosphokinase
MHTPKEIQRPVTSSPAQNDVAFIALGSNLGDSKAILLRVMDELQSLSAQPILASSLWQSSPVDCPPGSPEFVNAVVGFVPRESETPESLLEKLKLLEKAFGRKQKTMPNESRPLDLDLIAFKDEVRNTPELTLPHPRAHQRRFVLQPLNEIAPDLVLPGQLMTVARLLNELQTDEQLVRIADAPATPEE